MQQVKIGVQAMTIKKEYAELGAYEALKRLSDMGFGYVELSQVPMDKDSVLAAARACKDFNMEIVAISASLDDLLTGLDKIINDCKLLNCEYVRIGMMPISYLAPMSRLLEFCSKVEEAAKELISHNIKLYYHNHHFEFQKIDGMYIIDYIKEHSSLLGFELDVHWIQRGGVNPVAMIPLYQGKVDLLHLKDYRIKPITTDICEAKDYSLVQSYFDQCIQFAELGEGNLDLPAIIEAGVKAGTKYFLIEQDVTYDRTPFESLAITATNLTKMGYQYR